MMNDLGVEMQYIHDGTDHKQLRDISTINTSKSRYRKRKVIFLVRDPRDTVVSGYFQVQKRHKLQAGTFSEFIRSEFHGVEKIVKFNLGWFTIMPKMRSIKYLQYEDVHRDTVGSISGIVSFLGIPASPSKIIEVAENRTFEKMRASEAQGDLGARYGEVLQPGDNRDPESFKVRRGKVGGFREYLSSDDIAYCDEILANSRYWVTLDKVFRQNGLNYRALEQTRVAATG
ncbi:sulfotransferase domain-containing protein [Mesorhizobium sp. WSM4976]|uniref:sulfotransferase domain-containing protein n=1 Tax=Mesorhizobium sp. WSM4976 TaxID=3038549 RepID=UPI002415A23A|nr:sulfotransferase domain-containing protein [Mesorhizobium sp. WSM4976]MDG4897525.1 sulfotransferase domain-containing protein [Mesorhizobium sp. WSM4976]